MDDLGKACTWCLLGLLIVVISVVVNGLLGGWVLSVLWSWFIVPFGVAQITIFHALGIMTIISMFTAGLSIGLGRVIGNTQSSDSSEKSLSEAAIVVAITPLLYLFILFSGWVYHSLMVAYPNF